MNDKDFTRFIEKLERDDNLIIIGIFAGWIVFFILVILMWK